MKSRIYKEMLSNISKNKFFELFVRVEQNFQYPLFAMNAVNAMKKQQPGSEQNPCEVKNQGRRISSQNNKDVLKQYP